VKTMMLAKTHSRLCHQRVVSEEFQTQQREEEEVKLRTNLREDALEDEPDSSAMTMPRKPLSRVATGAVRNDVVAAL